MKPIKVPSIVSLLGGLAIGCYSIPLMLHGGFGISTVSSLPYAVSCITDVFTFGQLNYIFQAFILIFLLAVTRKFKMAYIPSFIISVTYGVGLDFGAAIVESYPTDLIWYRILWFALGAFLLCLGVYFMVRSSLPIVMDDMMVVALAEHYGVTFRRVKTLFDGSCIVMSLIVSLTFSHDMGGIGIGTILLALFTGQTIHMIGVVLDPIFDIRPIKDLKKGVDNRCSTRL